MVNNTVTRNIVCFGDSNVWGYVPGGAGRYSYRQRWTGLLADRLHGQANVLEDGLCGRTAGNYGFGPSTEADLVRALGEADSLSGVFIMLGTNDLMARLDETPVAIAEKIIKLAEIARDDRRGAGGRPPFVVIASPPPIQPKAHLASIFLGAERKLVALEKALRPRCKDVEATFFHTSALTRVSVVDGVHLDDHGHKLMAERTFEFLEPMLRASDVSAGKQVGPGF